MANSRKGPVWVFPTTEVRTVSVNRVLESSEIDDMTGRGANSDSNNHEVREIAPAVLNSQNVSRDDFPHCSMRERLFPLRSW